MTGGKWVGIGNWKSELDTRGCREMRQQTKTKTVSENTLGMQVSPRCDQCAQLRIDGVVCHEIGCPNMRKTYDPDREQWIAYRDCFECGFPVEVGETCDCME